MRYIGSIVFCLLVFATRGAAVAQSPSGDRVAELERTVRQLESRISALEVRLNKPEPNRSASVTGDAKDIRTWRQLRQKMVEADVERLLGVAGKVDVNEYFFTWYYSYPSGGYGYVRFNAKSRLVEEWSEP